MNKVVEYYRLGFQCYGTKYMGEKARELSKLLGYRYHETDIEKEPRLAQEKQLFFPGTIIVDGVKIVYPGSAKELAESYRLRGPLPGKHRYTALPNGIPDRIVELDSHLEAGAEICIGTRHKGFMEKARWASQHRGSTKGVSGFIAFNSDFAVAAIEFILEERCAYPIPHKRPDALFITCIYNRSDNGYDYRLSLLDELQRFMLAQHIKSASVIAGENTPYPNGPVSLFERAGFKRVKYLDQVLLRHQWEDITYLQVSFDMLR